MGFFFFFFLDQTSPRLAHFKTRLSSRPRDAKNMAVMRRTVETSRLSSAHISVRHMKHTARTVERGQLTRSRGSIRGCHRSGESGRRGHGTPRGKKRPLSRRDKRPVKRLLASAPVLLLSSCGRDEHASCSRYCAGLSIAPWSSSSVG